MVCSRFFLDFRVCSRFSWIFVGVLQIFVDFRGCAPDFRGFAWVCSRFSWICVGVLQIFVGFSWVCSRFSWIFVEVLQIFVDFRGCAPDFGGYSWVFSKFSWICVGVLQIFVDLRGCAPDFRGFSWVCSRFSWIFVGVLQIFVDLRGCPDFRGIAWVCSCRNHRPSPPPPPSTQGPAPFYPDRLPPEHQHNKLARTTNAQKHDTFFFPREKMRESNHATSSTNTHKLKRTYCPSTPRASLAPLPLFPGSGACPGGTTRKALAAAHARMLLHLRSHAAFTRLWRSRGTDRA